MVTAIVLIEAARGRVNAVAEQLAEQSGISEVYSVSGRYDLVAIIRVCTNDDLADLVAGKIAKIADIGRTETMLAFRTYSPHDLESMFGIGQ